MCGQLAPLCKCAFKYLWLLVIAESLLPLLSLHTSSEFLLNRQKMLVERKNTYVILEMLVGLVVHVGWVQKRLQPEGREWFSLNQVCYRHALISALAHTCWYLGGDAANIEASASKCSAFLNTNLSDLNIIFHGDENGANDTITQLHQTVSSARTDCIHVNDSVPSRMHARIHKNARK